MLSELGTENLEVSLIAINKTLDTCTTFVVIILIIVKTVLWLIGSSKYLCCSGYVWGFYSLLCPSTGNEPKGRQCLAIFENLVEVICLTNPPYWSVDLSFIWMFCSPFFSCASRNDMLEACDSRNLDILQKEFPLWHKSDQAATGLTWVLSSTWPKQFASRLNFSVACLHICLCFRISFQLLKKWRQLVWWFPHHGPWKS